MTRLEEITLNWEFTNCLEEERNDIWEKAARSESLKWTKWHQSQYNSWCLHDGGNSTLKRSRVNWNAQLIWKMRIEMAYQWDIVENEIPVVFEKLFDALKVRLLHLKTSVQGEAKTATNKKTALIFLDTVRARSGPLFGSRDQS
ncbi:MAG: hypothetical protein M1818_005047 [Claussenomyces sp. TS43310]|nr:MAG: hypothetical protein M1818_005047 [Claussenomyces sp. TS43310]